MALILKDRVKETTTVTGTGTATLLGAAAGFQSFSTIGNGNTTYYCITGGGSEWEVGIGTYTTSGTTLTRTIVLASSNSGSLVSFSAGTKDVFVTYPSDRSVNQDDVGSAPNQIPLNQYLGALAYLQQPYRKVQRQLATSLQTVFTITGGYALGYIDVYQNGVKLYSTDYTETNTSTITLSVGAVLNDEIEFVIWWV